MSGRQVLLLVDYALASRQSLTYLLSIHGSDLLIESIASPECATSRQPDVIFWNIKSASLSDKGIRSALSILKDRFPVLHHGHDRQ